MWTASIRQVHKSLIKGDTNVTKLCNEAFKIIDETKNLNSFITTCQDEAINQAKQLDHRLAQWLKDGNENMENPLYGIPISIKDNFCTNQILTTCGSRMLHNFIPPYSATVVDKLSKADSVMVGKTNMDEFAMGSSCTTSYYKHSANYWRYDRLAGEKPGESNSSNWLIAGGSSTGSAVSVASGACFASIGTDTGGSTRQPASLTGVVGFKPTYGLISRYGLIPLAHCLDVVSLLARTVDDISVIFEAVVGEDENDLTTVDHKKELKTTPRLQDLDNLSSSPIRIRVGIPEEFISNGNLSCDVSEHFSDMLKRISSKRIGNVEVELVKVDLRHANHATECYTIISTAEIASNMSCYDGVKYGLSLPIPEDQHFDRDAFFKANRDAGFGSEVKKRILLGNYFLLSANRETYLTQALKLRRLISEDFLEAFNQNGIDIIITPSTPTTSVTYAEWLQKQDCNKLFLEDYFLIPSNLANLPSISLPSGLSSTGQLPIGIQLISNRFHDLDLLSVARHLEQHVFEKNLHYHYS